MSNDVLITPASRKIEFKDSSANVDAKIETDASGNLIITNTGGDISIGDTTSDIFVGDGTNNIDIVFEQDGEIRGTSGVTVTLGQSDSNIRMATDLNLNSNDITNAGSITGASFSDGTISGITFIDEDSFATNSATRVPTQQSIKAYVDTQVAGVVDSAPAALDTLNELAAALGDDANFSTTTTTALGNRLRVDTAAQGLTGTQQANAITNLGITATKAELNYVDGVTSNIQTQLNGKQATGSYLTGNQTITLSGDVSGSGTTSIAVTVADDSHNHIISNVDGLQTALDAKLPLAGGTMTGTLFANAGINLGNTGISGVNALSFNDPGPNEGLSWTGGNTKIYESPDDLTTNTAGNLQFVYGTTRRLTVNSTGINVNGNITVSGTVDGVDIAARNGVLTSTTTTANAALPKTGGAMTGPITTNSTFDGRDVATDGAKLDGIAAGATNTVTNATHTGEVTGSGVLTIANDVVDAGNLKVTGNGTTAQFLRSDGDGTFTWATPTDTNTTYSVGAGGLTEQNFTTTLKNKLDGIAASANNYSFPYTVSASAGNSTVVQRHSSGYIYANYFNTTPNTVTSGITQICVETGNDGFIRHGTAAAVRTFINVENGATADQSAAEILTAIKTVDGAGSGLDADLLDGISSASFLRGDATDTFTTLSGTQLTANVHSANAGVNNGFTFWGTAETYSIKMGNNQADHGTVTDYSMHHNMGTTAGRGFTFGSSRTAVTCSINALTGAILSSNNITAYSDIRIKDNIKVIPNALDKVSQLSGYTFTRTDVEDKEKKYTGVLAQEVLKVLPEAVQLGATEKDTMSVAYGNMVGLLIEAIKELKTEVNDLKKQLKEIK